jgi:raffinose/stachyose/melibiose transport system substrate-binding protein
MKMKNMKVLLVGISLILVVGSIAACSSKKTDTTVNTATPVAAATDAPTATAVKETPEAKQVTLNMLFAESLFGNTQDEIIAAFEKENPNIKVKAESLPDGGIFDALRTRITTGEMPDLYQINIGHITTSMADEAGYIYDLKDMEAMKNYAPSVKEASMVNGKLANFSMGVGVLGLPYNKKALADAGYTEPFKTWEDMMAAGAKLKKSGKDLLVYSSKWETAISNVFHWTFGNKAYKDPEFKKAYLSNTIDWTKPGYRDVLAEGFKRFKELNQYVRTGSFTNEYAIAQQSFTNGESAMIIGGTWEAGTIHKLKPDLDLGFMNLPYSPVAENAYIFVPEDGIAINAKSKNVEAAQTFLNFVFNKENYAKIQKSKGSMSAEVGVGELDPAYADVPNWLNTDRVISFGNTGPIPGPTWVALGNSAQKYTFDGKLDAAIDRFITEYDKTKSKK